MTTTPETFDAQTSELLQRHGFDRETFEDLRGRLRRGEVGDRANRIQGRVEPPEAGDVERLPPPGTEEREVLAEIQPAGHLVNVITKLSQHA